MSTTNHSFRTVIAVAVLATAGIAATTATAAPAVDTQRVVKFQNVSLATAEGTASIYNRLQAASRAVCEPLAGRELVRVKQYNVCYEKALDAALRDVKSLSTTL